MNRTLHPLRLFEPRDEGAELADFDAASVGLVGADNHLALEHAGGREFVGHLGRAVVE